MPVATITPSIDVEALTVLGIKQSQETRDGLMQAPGILRGFTDTTGKSPRRWPAASDRWMSDIQVVEHTAVTSFTTGFESYDSTALTVQRPIAFGFGLSGVAAKIGSRQIRQYGNGDRLGEYTKRLITNCLGILHRGWQKRVVGATGTGFGDFTTLNGFDSTAGVFESAAKGSQTNTVGGFNKTTWAAAPGANNAVVDMANAFGSNFAQFGALFTQIELYKPVAGSKKFGLFSSSFRDNYKRYMLPQERWMNGANVDAGNVIEMFQGIKFYLEPYMPSAGAVTGAGNPISAMVIDADDIFPVWMPAMTFGNTEFPDGYFGEGEWRPISGLQDVYAMPFCCAGNVVVESFGSSGVIRRGNTY